MSSDGVNEELAILERLKGLAGGRILDGDPDDASIPTDDVGKVRPYITLSIGTPFADPAGARAFGDGEERIPYIMVVVVGCFAGDRDSLNALYKAVRGRLLGWAPDVDNATPFALRGGVNGSSGATDARPAQLSKIMAFRSTINLAVG
ncbi:hypothetical protein [Pseudolysinimonas sp.]|uniref:hypothetical protein n=1 Tax=Pseudolysinimonas sp. TaxID=2680009 RepID=UPI003F8132CE